MAVGYQAKRGPDFITIRCNGKKVEKVGDDILDFQFAAIVDNPPQCRGADPTALLREALGCPSPRLEPQFNEVGCGDGAIINVVQ